MDTRSVVMWVGPGEYTPVRRTHRIWIWCRAIDCIAGITLHNIDHAARLGRVIVAKGEH